VRVKLAIALDRQQLGEVLERALRDARDPKGPVSDKWVERLTWLSRTVAGGDAKGKTYIAATGGALLAKATDDRVDTLTQSSKGGGRGYGLRSVAELMQQQLRGKVHLGTLSKNPMNNAPFLRGPPRIERFTVAPYMQHVYDEYVGWMQELDGYDGDAAYKALVSFLRVRLKAQQDEDAAAAGGVRMTTAQSTADLLDALQLWITEDPEEGARGQALVAAALTLVWDDVEVVPKHHPAPFDVKRAGTPPPLVCECKQQVINGTDILELPRRAAARDADLALYAALDPRQPPLPIDRLRSDALERYGVLLDVVSDVEELIAHICVSAGIPAADVRANLPHALVMRCPQADVSAGGLRRLATLLHGP
jgi:hypothetical protein